jgi:hypothetical protein
MNDLCVNAMALRDKVAFKMAVPSITLLDIECDYAV